MDEYKINTYITLKLENKKTNIYVKGENFGLHCKKLILNIKLDEFQNFDKFTSMDEFAEYYVEKSIKNRSLKGHLIDPKVEFQAHCSNIQVWAENDYDTRLLHSGLSFPLLKKLTEMDDPVAKKVFKDEIAKRFTSNNINTQRFLAEEGYLTYLNDEEIESLLIPYNEVNVTKSDNYEVLGLIYTSKGHEYLEKQDLNTSNKYFQKAKEHFESFLEVNSKKWDVWYDLAHILNHLGKYEEAEEKYKRALEINPDDAYIWNELGLFLEKLNRYEEAIESYQESININSEQENTWFQIGVALNMLKKFEEAFNALLKSIKINPNNYMAWYSIGFALYKLYRYSDAIHCLEKALELNPENLRILEGLRHLRKNAINFYRF